MNGSVQFIGLFQIWDSGFPYIINLWDHVEATGWGSSSNGNPGYVTPGLSTVTGSQGERISHSTIYCSGNWDGSVNVIPADLPRSPANPRVA